MDIKYNNIVDEQTIVFGKNAEKTSPQETKKMLEERMDGKLSEEERAAYKKAWRNI